MAPKSYKQQETPHQTQDKSDLVIIFGKHHNLHFGTFLQFVHSNTKFISIRTVNMEAGLPVLLCTLWRGNPTTEYLCT